MQNDSPNSSRPSLADPNQAAEVLSISVATLRNWTAQGLVHVRSVIGRTKYYDREELYTIKEQIDNGKVAKLDKRRNKSARRESYIPMENVSDPGILATITIWIESVATPDQLPLMLREAALQLFISRGHLQAPDVTYDESLVQLALQQVFSMGPYAPLFLDGLTEEHAILSMEDEKLLRVMRQHPLRYSPDEDPLGLLYIGISQLSDRKGMGQYYTPDSLAKKLSSIALHQLDHRLCPRALDPACGSGKFLVILYRTLFDRIAKSGIDPLEAHRQLQECLVGYDINPVSVWLCKINLALEAPTVQDPSDCQFRIYTKDAMKISDGSSPFHEPFDLVIGNPPWGSKHRLSLEELDDYQTASAHDTYSLFMELSIHALKQNGILALLVPSSWLYVNKHLVTRSLMLLQTSIAYIGLTDNAFSSIMAPSMLIVARKVQHAPCEQIHIENMQSPPSYTISQKRFLANSGLLMNVQTQDPAQKVLDKMRKTHGAAFLKNQAVFALGIVTGNNKAWVSTAVCDDCVPVFKGLHIYKFGLKKSDLTIPLSAIPKFQQVAPLELFRAKEKLVYRFIHNQLIFAYDEEGVFTLNSANLLIPLVPNVSIKYLLALFNSRTAQFFYQSSFHSVKVLKSFLEAIPIPICSQAEQSLITSYVDHLILADSGDEKRDTYMQIEAMIFELFQLTAKEQALVLSLTKNSLKWISP